MARTLHLKERAPDKTRAVAARTTRRQLSTDRNATRARTYLRRQEKTQTRQSQPPPKHVYPPGVEEILSRADILSTTAYLPHWPGSFNRGSLLQSPAEKEYKRGLKETIKYGDDKSRKLITVRAGERLRTAGKLDRAYEWFEMSLDKEIIEKMGGKIARDYKAKAEAQKNSLILNELHIANFRKGAEIAAKSGNPELGKEIIESAARRYEEFGDMCMSQPMMKMVGLQFGFVRAMRWHRRAGNEDTANRISEKIERLYEGSIAINPVTHFAIATMLGDEEQTEMVIRILHKRRKKGKTD